MAASLQHKYSKTDISVNYKNSLDTTYTKVYTLVYDYHNCKNIAYGQD